MQFCNQCGAQMNDGAKFCPKCGAVSAQPQAPQYTQPGADQSFNAPGFNPNPNNYGQQQNPGQQNYGFNPNAQPQQQAKTGNFFKDILNTPDYTAQYDPQDIQQNKGGTIAAYFWILFWIPLAINSNSRYGRFHANQALLNLITSVAIGIVSSILQFLCRIIFVSEITFLGYGTGEYATNGFGWFLSGFFGFILALPSLAWLIIGLINAVNGRAKELPIIGKFRIIK